MRRLKEAAYLVLAFGLMEIGAFVYSKVHRIRRWHQETKFVPWGWGQSGETELYAVEVVPKKLYEKRPDGILQGPWTGGQKGGENERRFKIR